MQPAPTHLTPFEHPMRVYWEDTDAGGVVFYANYLKFFERARTEWLRALGIGQRALHEQQGLVFDSTIGLACVDAGTFRPRRIPNPILDALAAQHRPAPEQAQQEEP